MSFSQRIHFLVSRYQWNESISLSLFIQLSLFITLNFNFCITSICFLTTMFSSTTYRVQYFIQNRVVTRKSLITAIILHVHFKACLTTDHVAGIWNKKIWTKSMHKLHECSSMNQTTFTKSRKSLHLVLI